MTDVDPSAIVVTEEVVTKRDKEKEPHYPLTIVAGSTRYMQVFYYSTGGPSGASGGVLGRLASTAVINLYLPEELAARFEIGPEDGTKLVGAEFKSLHPFTWKAKWEPSKKRLFFVNIADRGQKAWKLSSIAHPETVFPKAKSSAEEEEEEEEEAHQDARKNISIPGAIEASSTPATPTEEPFADGTPNPQLLAKIDELEREEQNTRAEDVLLPERQERGIWFAKFQAVLEIFVSKYQYKFDEQHARDRVDFCEYELEQRETIAEMEYSERAVATLHSRDCGQEIRNREAREKKEAELKEAKTAFLIREEASRESIVREEAQQMIHLFAEEARAVVEIELTHVHLSREIRAERVCRDLLTSTWLNECFFVLLQTYYEYTLHTVRLYQHFLKLLHPSANELGRPAPVVRLEDLNFTPPSFAEEKWRSIERSDRPRDHPGAGPVGRLGATELPSASMLHATAASTKCTTIGHPAVTLRPSTIEHHLRRAEASCDDEGRNMQTPNVPFELAQANRAQLLEAAEQGHPHPGGPATAATGRKDANNQDNVPLSAGGFAGSATVAAASLTATVASVDDVREVPPPFQALAGAAAGNEKVKRRTHREIDLAWDDFQSRGVMLAEENLSAMYFVRQEPLPPTSSTPTAARRTSNSPGRGLQSTHSLGVQLLETMMARKKKDSFSVGNLGISTGEFLWQVRIRDRSTPPPHHHHHHHSHHPLSYAGDDHPAVIKVGMASRLYNGSLSDAPAYFYLEDGSVSCTADGSDATSFGDPLFAPGQHTESHDDSHVDRYSRGGSEAARTAGGSSSAAPRTERECIVTVRLNMDTWELSFAVNGVDQGVAFRFEPLPDPEPLFPIVVLSGAGQSAVLEPPVPTWT